MPELTDSLHQRLRCHTFDGILRSRVDIEHVKAIGLHERARELIHQVKRTGVAVRLKNHVNVPVAAQARSRERRANLGWMVAVIIDDRDVPLLAADLKSPVNAAVQGKSGPNLFWHNFQLERHADGGERVQHVVLAWHGEMELAQVHFPKAHAKITGERATTHVQCLDFGLRAPAVSDDAAPHERQNALHVLIRQTEDNRTVKRNFVDELDKSRSNIVERGITVQMLPVDVGDHRQNRGELQKGAVALIRLHHQKIAFAYPRVGAAHGRDFAADHHYGIEPRVVEHRRYHRSGCRLSMTAGDRDTVFKAHQFRQQFPTWDYRDLQAPRLLHFGILLVHRRTDYQCLGA